MSLVSKDVVSVRFQINPGAVFLRCESECTSSDPVLKAYAYWDVTGTRSAARIMGIIVGLTVMAHRRTAG